MIKKILLAIAIPLLFIQNVSAVLIPTGINNVLLDVNSDGELTGARNLDVFNDGKLYNVSFIDSSLATVFGDSSQFDASSQQEAESFANALLQYVFVDLAGSQNLQFDSNQLLTFGCSGILACYAVVPFPSMSSGGYLTADASNWSSESRDRLSFGRLSLNDDTGQSDISVIANFNLVSQGNSSINVPTPPSLLILVILGIVVLARINK